jgi:hypothetical protein
MALFSECSLKCARKVLDTADIVREAILRQQLRSIRFARSFGQNLPGWGAARAAPLSLMPIQNSVSGAYIISHWINSCCIWQQSA